MQLFTNRSQCTANFIFSDGTNTYIGQAAHCSDTGGNTSGRAAGDSVYSYGNSELRLGISLLSPKRGLSLGDGAGGWTHTVYTATPGIPATRGAASLTPAGALSASSARSP